MFTIANHPHTRARDASAALRAISSDVYPFSLEEKSLAIRALSPGESVSFDPVPWEPRTAGIDYTRPVVVTRDLLEGKDR